MRPLPIAELAEVCGGRLVWPGAAETDLRVGPDVVVDSRLITPGALFVALPGERVDGHDFAGRAAAAGAAAVLGSRPCPELATIVVADPAAALGRLARAVVEAVRGLCVIGITGSSGKTSTKDLLAQLLEGSGGTVSPVGSFNNEIGVPLTATQVGPDTRFLISEMGARGRGHISLLCRLTPPRIGLELNVGSAHVGEFGGREQTALAKSELVAGLPADGTAVLNADDPLVAAMSTPARIAWFAASGRPERQGELLVWAEDVVADARGHHRFTLCVTGRGRQETRHDVALAVSGAHQVSNALAAGAAALAAGVGVDDVARRLAGAGPRSRWRMEVDVRPDGVTVVNDAYNANPDSMRAALATVAEMVTARANGRGIAVVGDMLELGPETEAAHRELGALIAGLGFAEVWAVGEQAELVRRGATAASDTIRASVAPDKFVLAESVAASVRPGDVVVVKASRGLALETVAEALAASSRPGGASGDSTQPPEATPERAQTKQSGERQ